MKYKIHYEGVYQDALIVDGETMEEIKEKAFSECDKRNWEHKNCWSEALTK